MPENRPRCGSMRTPATRARNPRGHRRTSRRCRTDVHPDAIRDRSRSSIPRIGVVRIPDALGNRTDMNIAEIYMQQLWRWSADWRRVSSGVGIHSPGWRVSGATLWPRSRIPVCSTTRVKSAIVLLMVDGGSLDCPMILRRFRPVRMVGKRGAMPHQSAPCDGRQIAPIGWAWNIAELLLIGLIPRWRWFGCPVECLDMRLNPHVQAGE
jgi:hypothetical protein